MTASRGEGAGAGIPRAPDGGPNMVALLGGASYPSRAPAFDAEHSPCLRGPCRYYFEIWGHFDAGNAPDTPGLEEPMRQRAASCMRQSGVEMEVSSDSPVLECNQWDPLVGMELQERERRRVRWRNADLGETAPQSLWKRLRRKPREEHRATDAAAAETGTR